MGNSSFFQEHNSFTNKFQLFSTQSTKKIIPSQRDFFIPTPRDVGTLKIALVNKNINFTIFCMVTQKDNLGCGVASTAYVLGISYDKALKQFDINKVRSRGCYCKDIVNVLTCNGIQSRYKYVKQNIKKEIYKTDTIVFIKRSKRYPAGHYLVRTENGWHDSWINFTAQKDIRKVKSGIRKRLPGKSIYAIFIDM